VPEINKIVKQPKGEPTCRQRIEREPDYDTLLLRLREGAAPHGIARELAQRQSLSDVPEGTLKRILQKIKRRLMTQALPSFDKGSPTPIPEMLKALVERMQGVPDIRKLEQLAAKQLRRLEGALKLETEASLVLPGIREEMDLLHRIYLSIIKVKQELGLLHREPIRLEALLAQGTHEAVNPEAAAIDVGSRQRILSVVRKIRGELMPPTIGMESDDGHN
jgi:hypothetical protein